MTRRRLGVNVDHVATIRQSRRTIYPDPMTAAAICELAGADQVTVHLREDRRHIQERDLRVLRESVQTTLNLEMAATQEMVKIAYDVKPDVATLVPERREELTTEGGLDVARHKDHVKKYVQSLKDGDITVSLFIDPDLDQVRAAHRIESQAVELHTGKFCDARGESEKRAELQRIADAARAASKLGLRVAAGHGINYHNLHDLLPISEIEEYNIGHAIIAQSIFVGLDRAVRDMIALLNP